MAVTRKLRFDPIACSGHGLCAALYPEGIRLDDWGYPIITTDVVDHQDVEHAKRAVKACPDLALTIITERSKAEPR